MKLIGYRNVASEDGNAKADLYRLGAEQREALRLLPLVTFRQFGRSRLDAQTPDNGRVARKKTFASLRRFQVVLFDVTGWAAAALLHRLDSLNGAPQGGYH